MKVKRLAGVAVCAATIVGFGGPVFAGEWAPGQDRLTPIKTDGVASSECAFSGRDQPDTINGGGEPAGPEGYDDFLWGMTPAKGNVQSPGQLVAAFGPDGNAGVPGTACRGGG